MGSKRTVILIAAILIGAIAGYALYTYVTGVEERAYDNAKRVKVFMVAEDIPANTPADAVLGSRLIVEKEIPAEFLPPTALADTKLITGKVAATDLVQGQVVVTGMFADQAEVTSTWADRLEVDQVAVTISVDQVKAVGGLLQPGDKVSMLVRVAQQSGATDPTATPAVSETPVSFLYQNVQILAIGNVGVGQNDPNNPTPTGGVMTLAVPPDAAQRIVYAADSIYLLLEPKGYVATDLPPIDASNLFDKPLTPEISDAGQ